MMALACGFSKPANLLLGVKPAGAISPMREAVGNTGSAAWAGAANVRANATSSWRRICRECMECPLEKRCRLRRHRIHRRKMGDNAAGPSDRHGGVLRCPYTPGGRHG